MLTWLGLVQLQHRHQPFFSDKKELVHFAGNADGHLFSDEWGPTLHPALFMLAIRVRNNHFFLTLLFQQFWFFSLPVSSPDQGCAIIPFPSQISILMSRYCKILWYWGVIDIAVFWIWLLLLILTLQKNFLHYHYWYWYCKIQPTSINIDIGIAKQNERNVFLKLVLQNVLSIRMCKIYT